MQSGQGQQGLGECTHSSQPREATVAMTSPFIFKIIIKYASHKICCLSHSKFISVVVTKPLDKKQLRRERAYSFGKKAYTPSLQRSQGGRNLNQPVVSHPLSRAERAACHSTRFSTLTQPRAQIHSLLGWVYPHVSLYVLQTGADISPLRLSSR